MSEIQMRFVIVREPPIAEDEKIEGSRISNGYQRHTYFP